MVHPDSSSRADRSTTSELLHIRHPREGEDPSTFVTPAKARIHPHSSSPRRRGIHPHSSSPRRRGIHHPHSSLPRRRESILSTRMDPAFAGMTNGVDRGSGFSRTSSREQARRPSARGPTEVEPTTASDQEAFSLPHHFANGCPTVSFRKKVPMTTVISATAIGYHRPL